MPCSFPYTGIAFVQNKSVFSCSDISTQDEYLEQLLKGLLNRGFSNVAAHCNQLGNAWKHWCPGVPPRCCFFYWHGWIWGQWFLKLHEWLQYASKIASCQQWLWTNPERYTLGLAPTRTDLANWLLMLLPFARTWHLNLRNFGGKPRNSFSTALKDINSNNKALEGSVSGESPMPCFQGWPLLIATSQREQCYEFTV